MAQPQPTLIEYGHLRFLVMDAPSDQTLPLYIKELVKHHVTDVVRVCTPSYSTTPLEQLSIQIHDWSFGDGEPPPSDIIDKWLELVQLRFGPLRNIKQAVAAAGDTSPSITSLGSSSPATQSSSHQPSDSMTIPICIATHCVAGLGRAPVLVALALIESGMSPLDSVLYIRERRRGAINNKQLNFLENYKRRLRKKPACLVS